MMQQPLYATGVFICSVALCNDDVVKMFPIIPQHLVKVTLDDDNSEASATPKVVAGMYIPRGTCSESFCTETFCQQDMKPFRVYQVHMAGDKLIGAERWAPGCRLAPDCQSCNLLLQQEGCSLVLQVLRPIQPGEELLIWFSQQLLAILGIPCLAPANIQGDKRYVCLECGRHFETPNPLKLHLALDCDRFDRDHLWKRLLQRDLLPQTSSLIGLNFELVVPSREIKPSLEPCDLSVTVSHKNDSTEVTKDLQHQRSVKCIDNRGINVMQTKRAITEPSNDRGSAFKPYRGQRSSSSNIIGQERTLLPLLMPTSSQLVFHRATSLATSAALRQELMGKSNKGVDPSSLPDQQCTAADVAQLEMNLSNFSRSKQGHLCIYCGKIYSRKYGLKIHIRTHTGYKPLKCKYCLRPFGDPSNLNKHVRLHAEGDTPYKCGLCGKILVRRRDLERHIRSRHSPHLVQEVTSSSVLSLQNTS